jgi:hypothetical protein
MTTKELQPAQITMLMEVRANIKLHEYITYEFCWGAGTLKEFLDDIIDSGVYDTDHTNDVNYLNEIREGYKEFKAL